MRTVIFHCIDDLILCARRSTAWLNDWCMAGLNRNDMGDDIVIFVLLFWGALR